MRRFRFELVLVLVVVVALVVTFVLRGARVGTGGGEGREVTDPLAGAGPCLAAAFGERVAGPSASEADVGSVAPVLERIRELTFEEQPEPVYLGPEDLRERLDRMVDDEDQMLAVQERLLTELGALPEGSDLEGELEELLGEQVAGLYDPESKELIVLDRAAQDGLTTVELLALVHELQHALADQRLGIPDLEALNAQDQDAATAAQALVEGDAQLTTEAYALRSLDPADALSAAGEEVPGLGDTPHVLARHLLFPYLEGARFACHLYEEGGWDAVDAAYEDLPRSSAEILFPERYGSGADPVDPADPRGLPSPWEERAAMTFGAADLLFLFEAPGGDPTRGLADARERVRGWRGGEAHVWAWGDRTAVGLVLSASDGGAMCESVATWWRRTAQGDDDATEEVPAAALATDGRSRDGVLFCEDGSVRLGVGPDLAVARAAVR